MNTEQLHHDETQPYIPEMEHSEVGPTTAVEDNIVKLPPYVINEMNPILPQSQTTDWGLNKLGIPSIHSAGLTGKGVLVAVIDTGVNENHPDLRGAIVKNINVTAEPMASTNSHGTGVAGCIAARNNGSGVLGVAPDCQIVAIKAMRETGSGVMSEIVAGIDTAIAHKVHIINLSLGTTQDVPAMKAAIKRASDAGIYVVCSAGNAGQTDSVMWPARYDSTIAVAATSETGNISAFSSMGMEVDIAAPGERILACWKDGYSKVSGTCIRGDQMVHTETGYVPISKIEIGDKVYTLNEQTRELELKSVINKISNGIKTIYSVKTGSNNIVCTDNHPFFKLDVADAGERNIRGQRNYERNLNWVQLKDMIPGDSIVMSRVKKDDNSCKRVLDSVREKLPTFNEDTAYFMGYWLGDGWYNPNGITIYAKREFWEDLLDKAKLAFPDASIRNTYREDRDEYNIHISGLKLKEILKDLGLNGGAKNKRIPDFVYGLPKIYREQVLAGIFDSDGTINTYDTGVSFGKNACLKVSSKEFAKGFKRLMESLDIRCSNVYEQTKDGGYIRGRKLKETTSYSSTSSQFYKLNLIKDYLLDTRYVDVLEKNTSDVLAQNTVGRVKVNGRKVRPLSLEGTDLFYEKITEIKELGEDEVWDITVDGNHNFLCENFIVHNSFSSPILAGVLALFIEAKILITNDRLGETAIDIEEPGKDVKSGYGLVNPGGFITKFKPVTPDTDPFGKVREAHVLITSAQEALLKAYRSLELYLTP